MKKEKKNCDLRNNFGLQPLPAYLDRLDKLTVGSLSLRKTTSPKLLKTKSHPYFGETALTRYYKDFSAVATKQYGGLIRYGLLVDNNITYESIMATSHAITNTLHEAEIKIVDSLVKQRLNNRTQIISSKDGLPRKETIIEIFNERFDYLESLGLPLTISRYYITTSIERDISYLILALDN